MALVTALVTLDRYGLLPEDRITNTYHFEDDAGFSSDGGIETNGPGLVSRLDAFYKSIGTSFLAPSLTGTGTVRLYNVADAKPRVPRLESPITFTVAGAAAPAEIALCLSFNAATQSGTNAARRRGRVFLGPIKQTALLHSTAQTDARPSDVTCTNLLAAAKTMATGGAGAFRLVVFSPTTLAAGGTLDGATNDVVRLTVDNAFDTIRSRGGRRTARFAVNISGSAAPVPIAA